MVKKKTYGESQREYLAALNEQRHAAARKADPKAYDAYWSETYARLFPGK